MRTLKVGQKNHLELSYITYCGMPSKDIFSIAVTERVNRFSASSYNLYFPLQTDHIIAAGKFYTIHKVSPEEILLQEMR